MTASDVEASKAALNELAWEHREIHCHLTLVMTALDQDEATDGSEVLSSASVVLRSVLVRHAAAMAKADEIPLPWDAPAERMVRLLTFTADRKVSVVALVRELTGWSLKAAKEAVEATAVGPTDLIALRLDKAEAALMELREVGATAELL